MIYQLDGSGTFAWLERIPSRLQQPRSAPRFYFLLPISFLIPYFLFFYILFRRSSDLGHLHASEKNSVKVLAWNQDLHQDFAQIALAKEGSLIQQILKPLLLKIALWKGRGVTFVNQFFFVCLMWGIRKHKCNFVFG